MAFTDFPFEPALMRGRSRDSRRFCGHEEVRSCNHPPVAASADVLWQSAYQRAHFDLMSGLQVEAYLRAFAEAYDLEHLVRCRTRVLRVEPLAADSPHDVFVHEAPASADGRGPAANGAGSAANGADPAACHRWRVTSEPVPDDPRLSAVTVPAPTDAAGGGDSEEFGAVVVCNGHYSEPRLPRNSGPLQTGRLDSMKLFESKQRLPRPDHRT